MSDAGGFDSGYVTQNGGSAPASSGTAAAPVSYVYWPGAHTPIIGTRPEYSSQVPVPASSVDTTHLSTVEAVWKLYDMLRNDPAGYKKIVDKLAQFGLVDPNAPFQTVLAAWKDAVNLGAAYTSQGQDTSPFDAISLLGDPAQAKKALKPGESQVDQQATSVNIPGPSQTRSAINAAFQAALGRDPTAKELAKVQAKLTSAARSNPNMTTQTTSMDMAGQTSQSTESTGGVDLNQIAEDAAKESPDYSGYKAVGLLNTFASILGPAATL